MFEFICSIPESLGWSLVGCLGTLCGIMLYKLIKVFVQMWKDWHEDRAIESES